MTTTPANDTYPMLTVMVTLPTGETHNTVHSYPDSEIGRSLAHTAQTLMQRDFPDRTYFTHREEITDHA